MSISTHFKPFLSETGVGHFADNYSISKTSFVQRNKNHGCTTFNIINNHLCGQAQYITCIYAISHNIQKKKKKRQRSVSLNCVGFLLVKVAVTSYIYIYIYIFVRLITYYLFHSLFLSCILQFLHSVAATSAVVCLFTPNSNCLTHTNLINMGLMFVVHIICI